jgi:hypothetical protein
VFNKALSSSALVIKEDIDFLRALQKLDAKFFNNTCEIVQSFQIRPSRKEKTEETTKPKTAKQTYHRQQTRINTISIHGKFLNKVFFG